MHILIVAAVADNDVIGRAGGLPWRIKSELQHFRAITMGKPVVMGRKTYQSIGKPLEGRTNIVVTGDPGFAAAGILVVPTLGIALTIARGDALRRGADEIAVVGGAQIYAQAIEQADRMIITRVHLRPQGDVQFPSIDPLAWEEVARKEHPAGPDEAPSFTTILYHRRGASAENDRKPH